MFVPSTLIFDPRCLGGDQLRCPNAQDADHGKAPVVELLRRDMRGSVS